MSQLTAKVSTGADLSCQHPWNERRTNRTSRKPFPPFGIGSGARQQRCHCHQLQIKYLRKLVPSLLFRVKQMQAHHGTPHVNGDTPKPQHGLAMCFSILAILWRTKVEIKGHPSHGSAKSAKEAA